MIYLKTSTDGFTDHKDQQGIGSVCQWSLILYCICEHYNFKFVADSFTNIGHWQYNNTDQSLWDKNYTSFFNFPKPPENTVTKNFYGNLETLIELKNLNENIIYNIPKSFIKNNGFSPEHLSIFFKNKYLNKLKNNFNYNLEKIYDDKIFNIALHLRTVNPSDTYIGPPYFDIFNVHVKIQNIDTLIKNIKQKFLDKKINIYIHSQGKENIFESLYNNNDNNCTINLMLNKNTIFDIYHMSNSDLFIMAKSSFSWICHLLNVNNISAIREKFWHNTYPNTLKIGHNFSLKL
jgi:hypothetical protein